MRQFAEKYRELGYHVLPTKQDKSPNGIKWTATNPNFKGFSDAYGVGLACGKLSGGLECIDIDNHFGNAREMLEELLSIEDVKEIFNEKKLVVEKTVSGGFHILFKSDFCGNNQKLAERGIYDEKLKKDKPDTLIETRGEGGYFVCYPTPGYDLFIGNLDNIQKISEQEREILISASKSFNEWFPEERQISHIIPYEGVRVGDMYNEDAAAVEECRELLEQAGWVIKKHLCTRPGKTKGTSATYGKVAPGVLYVFSSNAYPFELNKGYKPFSILSLLKFNGDFKETAKYLAEKYSLNKPNIFIKTVSNKPDGPIFITTSNNQQTNDLDKILEKTKIDPKGKEPIPPVALSIVERSGTSTVHIPLFTLGNISSIIGQQKSKKTYASSKLIAALISQDSDTKVKGELPGDKNKVVVFDTEQSRYHAQKVCRRISYMSGRKNDSLIEMFALRELSPKLRIQVIEHYIKKTKNLGFVLIDGIVDLSTDFNNLEQSQEIVSWLMQLSAEHAIHISSIIHQNKSSTNARGHLGTILSQKSETVLEIEKIDNSSSKIIGKDTRNKPFEEFMLYIDGNGNAHFSELDEIESYDPMK